MAKLQIGQVATRAGVAVDTVRYYEKRGLLPVVERRESGYRVFGEDAVARIRTVKGLQELGLGLEEIGAMIVSVSSGATGCADEADRIRAALARTEEKLAALEVLRGRLSAALGRCATAECALVDEIRCPT